MLSFATSPETAVAELRGKIEQIWREQNREPVVIESNAELPLSEDAKFILAYASYHAERLEHQAVTPGHLFLAMSYRSSELLGKVFGSYNLSDSIIVSLGQGYLSSPDRIDVVVPKGYGIVNVPAKGKVLDELHRLIEKFQVALNEKRFDDAMALNEKIEELRVELQRADAGSLLLDVTEGIIFASSRVSERLVGHFAKYPNDLRLLTVDSSRSLSLSFGRNLVTTLSLPSKRVTVEKIL